VVYVESNIGHIPGRNSILAFKRDAAGHLTQFGEYLTGGTGVHPNDITLGNLAGTLGPFDSDQDIIMNFDDTQLFAVNSGSDTIAVFDVRSDGGLVPVKGSPFPSGGTQPVSLGLSPSQDTLVVVNKDYDLKRPGFNVKKRSPNYTAFRVKPDGKLDSPSKIEAGKGGGFGPGNTTPTQAMVSPKGGLVFDADTSGSAIHSFTIRPNGNLERVATHGTPSFEFIPFPLIANPAGRPFVLGLVAHPREPVFYAGFVFEGKAGVYTYNRTGEFQFVRSATAGLGICWLAVNGAGDRAYTSNTLLNSVSVLDTTDPLNPVKLQDFPLPGAPLPPAPGLAGAGSEQLALDVRDEYLFVVTQKSLDIMSPNANALHVLRIAPDGTIAEQTDRVVISVAPSLPQGVVAR
jgi:hypothetical protein